MDDLVAFAFLVLLMGTLLLIFAGVLFAAVAALAVVGLVLFVPFVLGFIRGVRGALRK